MTNEYEIEQMHFHSPSEHTIDGNHYALELHFVHQNVKTHLTAAVVVVFFDLQDEAGNNTFLEGLIPDLYFPEPADDEEFFGPVNLATFFS